MGSCAWDIPRRVYGLLEAFRLKGTLRVFYIKLLLMAGWRMGRFSHAGYEARGEEAVWNRRVCYCSAVKIFPARG